MDPPLESRNQFITVKNNANTNRTTRVIFLFKEKTLEPLYTCPKDEAAIGSGLMSAKIFVISRPNWVSIDLIATSVGNGGIWSYHKQKSLD